MYFCTCFTQSKQLETFSAIFFAYFFCWSWYIPAGISQNRILLIIFIMACTESQISTVNMIAEAKSGQAIQQIPLKQIRIKKLPHIFRLQAELHRRGDTKLVQMAQPRVPQLFEDHRTVVIKATSKCVRESRNSYLHELEVHTLCGVAKHPNILPCYPLYIETDESYVLATEYANCGSLSDNLSGISSTRNIAGALLEISNALDHVHFLGFVHFDIKRSNIMMTLNPDGSKTAKIMDFGSTWEIGYPLEFGRALGFTRGYAAPELWIGPTTQGQTVRASPGMDVWSLGVVIARLYEGVPWKEANDSDQDFKKYRSAIANDGASVESAIKGGLMVLNSMHQVLQDLVVRMLQPNPKKRCSISTVRSLLTDFLMQSSSDDSPH